MPLSMRDRATERLAGRLLDALSALRRAEESAAAQRRTAHRLARLHATTAALSAAVTPDDVARVVADHACGAVPGASGATVAFLDEDARALVVAARCGDCAGAREPGARVPVAADDAIAAAARERRPRFLKGNAAGLEACDAFGGQRRATAAVPLALGARVLGAMAISFSPRPPLEEDERADLLTLAALGAQALERARLFDSERAARLEAQHAVERARHAIDVQQKLVAVLGHDLRTPLQAVEMAVTLLRRRGQLSDDQARTLARLAASAGRMHGLVRDLLDFTRIRSGGGIPLQRRAADLAEICRRAIAELQDAHPRREIELLADGAAPVLADPERIAQVVSNLCGNAVQHSPPDSRIEVRVREERAAVELSVHNDGPPIGPDVASSLFEPFRRGAAASDASGSIGLGLFIVRELVRAHGGDVAVRSVAGEGTTFTVRLPSSGAVAAGCAPAAVCT